MENKTKRRGRTSTVMFPPTLADALKGAAERIGNSQAALIRAEIHNLRASFPELEAAFQLVGTGKEPHLPGEKMIAQVTAGLSESMMLALDYAERLSGIPPSAVIRLAILRSTNPAIVDLLPAPEAALEA